MTKVYKVCHQRFDGTLHSAWLTNREDLILASRGIACTYAVGKTTRPRKGCGPLMAFKTLEDARKWALQPTFFCSQGSYPIFEAIGVPYTGRKPKMIVDALFSGCVAEIKGFWKAIFSHKDTKAFGRTALIPNTILCNSIKLLREVR